MIFLDFDGVLADSAQECYTVVSNLFAENSFEIKNKFLQNRYLVKEPYGFYILFKLLLDGNNNRDIKTIYKKKYENISNLNKLKYTNNFFKKREELIKKEGLDCWCQLNPPTKFFVKFMKYNSNKSKDFIIVSTKNSDEIDIWVKYYKMNPHSIYGNESYVHSKNKFSLIKNVCNFDDNQSNYFVDDNYEHITGNDWISINCIPLYAKWGYNNSDEDNTDSIIDRIFE